MNNVYAAGLRPLTMLIAPDDAVHELKPVDVGLCLLICMGAILSITIVAQPFVIRALGDDLPGGALSGTAAVTLALIQAVFQIGILSVKWAFIAYVLWAFASVLGRPEPFLSALGVVVLAETAFVLQRLFNLVWVVAMGSRVDGAATLEPRIGLNVLLTDLPQAWDSLANQANLFALWYILILAVGTKTLFGLSRTTAFGLAFGVWLCLFSLRAALVFASSGGFA